MVARNRRIFTLVVSKTCQSDPFDFIKMHTPLAQTSPLFRTVPVSLRNLDIQMFKRVSEARLNITFLVIYSAYNNAIPRTAYPLKTYPVWHSIAPVTLIHEDGKYHVPLFLPAHLPFRYLSHSNPRITACRQKHV